ncbi:bacterial low temperature requirement A protein-domain-containing protein [Chaetomidium leptoderma]|uniref:Bacterial low temperature requirement A protein-domain-containing protein n=1 Tax=Chaetomidium leptoderma TaxID=669021 RepID=A0AAN6VND4_9PEZI|nr:bacterial low temperature requirement A protein-domain-containing protein [Chaetomidium leptoderma]
MAPFHRQKTIHVNRTKRRLHTIVPWIQNPLQGVDKERLVFAPRHEASTLELFFDLFFVANLATFTAYHYIVDHSSLFAYIGFFTIIWVTWFHTVLYDVRFENDSIFSRACKTVMMIAFVGFALVGSSFAPGTDKGDNTSFRILCYTLVLSRVLFSIQYTVVGVFVGLARRTDLYLPVFLNVLTYLVAAGAYAAMIPAFADSKPVASANGIYSVWWIVLLVETIATMGVSCFWRMLSFKKTHLVERMGLLTLIVIGEGAIGVTKTISRMMGKSGLDPEGSGLVLCIVLMLIGTWMIYFDNHPHGHFGTIKQQIWAALHFPIHLAIVGLAEGAQQIALARYVSKGISNLETSLVQYCLKDHLDGKALTAKLLASINLIFLDEIESNVYLIGNSTGICGPAVTGIRAMDLPDAFLHLHTTAAAAMYSALGLSMPLDKDVIEIMFESWKLVYRYFWSAFLLLVGCFLVVMVLIRTTKMDAFDYVSLFDRGVVLVIAAALLGLSAGKDLMYSILETPFILPVAVLLLYLIIFFDRFGAWIANRRNRKSGHPLTGGGADSHGHGHEHGHEHGHGHGEGPEGGHPQAADKQSLIVSSTPASPHRDKRREERRVSYNPLGTAVMPSYSPDDTPPAHHTFGSPQPSPPVAVGVATATAYAPGGYMPVHNSHYAGAGY